MNAIDGLLELQEDEPTLVKSSLKLRSSTKNILHVVSDIVNFVTDKVDVDAFALTMGVSEALANAVIHGNRLDPKKEVSVDVAVGFGKVEITICDQGQGFHHSITPNPTLKQNLRKPHGRGLFLIRHFMDDVRFNRRGNAITMVKHVAREQPAPV